MAERLTEQQAGELRYLIRKWNNHTEYTDDPEYGLGVESGYRCAAYDLEDWLNTQLEVTE